MKARTLLSEAAEELRKAGIDEPEANSEWLLAYASGLDRLSLTAFQDVDINEEQGERFRLFVETKKNGIPLAYIVGSQQFLDINLKVDERVLVPRPETEELAEYCAAFLGEKNAGGADILDYGTGSGAIGLWLLTRFPGARLLAADISRGAADCASANAEALGLSARVSFLVAGTVKEVAYRSADKFSSGFDLIVSNPPYIPTEVIAGLSPEVQCEPRVALDGGPDGLSVARDISADAAGCLKSGGALYMELGDGMPDTLLSEMQDAVWTGKRALKDFAGKRRFLVSVKI